MEIIQGHPDTLSGGQSTLRKRAGGQRETFREPEQDQAPAHAEKNQKSKQEGAVLGERGQKCRYTALYDRAKP